MLSPSYSKSASNHKMALPPCRAVLLNSRNPIYKILHGYARRFVYPAKVKAHVFCWPRLVFFMSHKFPDTCSAAIPPPSHLPNPRNCVVLNVSLLSVKLTVSFWSKYKAVRLTSLEGCYLMPPLQSILHIVEGSLAYPGCRYILPHCKLHGHLLRGFWYKLCLLVDCAFWLWPLLTGKAGEVEKLGIGTNSLWSLSSSAFCLLPLPTPVLEEDNHHLSRVSAPP